MITYSAALKTTRMNAVKTAIDAGGAGGKVDVYTTGYGSLLVSITLSYPSSTVAGSVLTLDGLPKSGVAGNPGLAAIAKITTSAGTVIADGLTVGTVGTDIIIDNTNIAAGQTVNLNTGTITHG